MIATPLKPLAEIRLQELFHAIAEPVCAECGITMDQLRSRCKSHAIVRARGKIIERCRQRIFYKNKPWCDWEVIDEPRNGYQPISTTMLARLLGLRCHSTIVCHMKRRRNDAAPGVPALTGVAPSGAAL